MMDPYVLLEMFVFQGNVHLVPLKCAVILMNVTPPNVMPPLVSAPPPLTLVPLVLIRTYVHLVINVKLMDLVLVLL
jgi:hypothetical protein